MVERWLWRMPWHSEPRPDGPIKNAGIFQRKYLIRQALDTPDFLYILGGFDLEISSAR